MKNTKQGREENRGLTRHEVEQSRERYGSNVLTPPRQRSVILQFLDKFNDPLIKILLVALLLSIGIACYQYFFVGGSNGSKLLLEPMGISRQ